MVLALGEIMPYLTPSTSPLVKLQSLQAPLPTSFIINTCTASFRADWAGLSFSSPSEGQHSIPWLLPTLPSPSQPHRTGMEFVPFPQTLLQPGLAADQ